MLRLYPEQDTPSQTKVYNIIKDKQDWVNLNNLFGFSFDRAVDVIHRKVSMSTEDDSKFTVNIIEDFLRYHRLTYVESFLLDPYLRPSDSNKGGNFCTRKFLDGFDPGPKDNTTTRIPIPFMVKFSTTCILFYFYFQFS